MSKRRHVFISHHHADDDHVSNLTQMLARQDYEVRNSSIRAKPANQERLDKGLIPEATLKRLLRMKMNWASTVIVLIGKETHQRSWVDWEIRKAHELGKRIIGIYTRGGIKADIPPAFEKYGNALKNWNSNSIIQAIEGEDNSFETPDGVPREPVHVATKSRC